MVAPPNAKLYVGIFFLIFQLQAIESVCADDGIIPPLHSASSQFYELRPRVGVPELVLETLGGKPVAFSKFSGSVVLLAFWATWCPPCRRELPALARLQDKYDKKDLQILPLSVDSGNPSVVTAFLKRTDTRGLTVFVDANQRTYAASDAEEKVTPFRLYGMPITYVLDRKGIVIGYITGEVDWESSEAKEFLEYLTRE